MERHLAAFRVPQAPAAWIAAPAGDALAAVPRELVKRLRVLPLRLEGRLLHVAMRDPCATTQRDELGRATGFGIQPYAIADVRLSALLEHHYGIPGELRIAEDGFTPPGSPRERTRAAAEPEAEELIDEETSRGSTPAGSSSQGEGAGPGSSARRRRRRRFKEETRRAWRDAGGPDRRCGAETELLHA
jgi:hypothetical protein